MKTATDIGATTGTWGGELAAATGMADAFIESLRFFSVYDRASEFMLIEFILVKQATTATFFLLLVVSFFDVLGGFAVTLRSAQRDITVEGVERAL